jgi:Uma2 family endonuclease
MGMAISIPRYTIDDLDRLPDDGNRYEVLDGMLIVTPSPSVDHQRIATDLARRLGNHVSPEMGIVVAPGAMQSGDRTQLQPDILVYSAKHRPAKQWREISDHWLAVEVLSRSSRIYDRDFKRDAYFALGVSEVWLVDLEARAVEVSRATGTVETVRDVVRWCPPGSDKIRAIDLAELFHVLD